jgi:hypothetical protein
LDFGLSDDEEVFNTFDMCFNRCSRMLASSKTAASLPPDEGAEETAVAAVAAVDDNARRP